MHYEFFQCYFSLEKLERQLKAEKRTPHGSPKITFLTNCLILIKAYISLSLICKTEVLLPNKIQNVPLLYNTR